MPAGGFAFVANRSVSLKAALPRAAEYCQTASRANWLRNASTTSPSLSAYFFTVASSWIWTVKPWESPWSVASITVNDRASSSVAALTLLRWNRVAQVLLQKAGVRLRCRNRAAPQAPSCPGTPPEVARPWVRPGV